MPGGELTGERMAELGLVEVPVPGTLFSLLGPKKPGAHLSIDARVEMARRHNAVAHALPRYVRTEPPKEAEANATQPQENGMTKGKTKGEGAQAPKGAEAAASSTTPAPAVAGDPPTAAEVQKMFDANKGEWEKNEKDKKEREAKQKKEAEAKQRKEAALRKAAKKKDARPKRSAAAPEAAKGGKKKAAPAAAPKKAGGIGGFVSDLLVKGKDTEAILKAVKEKFPKARTSAASVAWYRSKLREEGKIK